LCTIAVVNWLRMVEAVLCDVDRLGVLERLVCWCGGVTSFGISCCGLTGGGITGGIETALSRGIRGYWHYSEFVVMCFGRVSLTRFPYYSRKVALVIIRGSGCYIG
jgi:hypothetical protein